MFPPSSPPPAASSIQCSLSGDQVVVVQVGKCPQVQGTHRYRQVWWGVCEYVLGFAFLLRSFLFFLLFIYFIFIFFFYFFITYTFLSPSFWPFSYSFLRWFCPFKSFFIFIEFREEIFLFFSLSIFVCLCHIEFELINEIFCCVRNRMGSIDWVSFLLIYSYFFYPLFVLFACPCVKKKKKSFVCSPENSVDHY